MMKQLKILSLAILLTVPFSLGFLTTPEKAEAGVVSLEGIKYDVNFSLEDNLKSLAGKRVYVTLDSGKTFTGTVKEVGNHLLWLEKLEGKADLITLRSGYFVIFFPQDGHAPGLKMGKGAGRVKKAPPANTARPW